MPITPVNDPVMGRLRKSGLPNTPENYNRMRDAMRMGGWSGGHQPYTAEMDRGARGYIPTESVDGEVVDASNDVNEYMDELANDGNTTVAPEVIKSSNKSNTTQTSSGGEQEPSDVATVETNPFEGVVENGELMLKPEDILPKKEEGGFIEENPMTSGIIAALAAAFAGRHVRGKMRGKGATNVQPAMPPAQPEMPKAFSQFAPPKSKPTQAGVKPKDAKSTPTSMKDKNVKSNKSTQSKKRVKDQLVKRKSGK